MRPVKLGLKAETSHVQYDRGGALTPAGETGNVGFLVVDQATAAAVVEPEVPVRPHVNVVTIGPTVKPVDEVDGVFCVIVPDWKDRTCPPLTSVT